MIAFPRNEKIQPPFARSMVPLGIAAFEIASTSSVVRRSLSSSPRSEDSVHGSQLEARFEPIESWVPGDSSSQRTVRCLFLDDDEDFLLSIQQFLKILSPSLKVYVASRPSRGLDSCRRFEFDLIFVDFRLPEMNGTAFVREARKILPRAHYVLITAHAGLLAGHLEEFSRDVDSMLLKPLQTGPFLDWIRVLMKSAIRQRAD